ncbi:MULTISPECIES: hypothetical protein [unclassified Streptomyces]|uniref:hypothetical protein n=1 Tax=Streptomyces sp. SID6137 TaxID=2690319 RepID=UPI001EF160C7
MSMPSRYVTQRSPAPPTASSSAAIGPIAERSGSQPKKVPDIGCNSRSYRSRWWRRAYSSTVISPNGVDSGCSGSKRERWRSRVAVKRSQDSRPRQVMPAPVSSPAGWPKSGRARPSRQIAMRPPTGTTASAGRPTARISRHVAS